MALVVSLKNYISFWSRNHLTDKRYENEINKITIFFITQTGDKKFNEQHLDHHLHIVISTQFQWSGIQPHE